MILQPDDKPDVARAALELVRESVFVLDSRNERIVDVNRAACEALGSSRHQLVGRSWPTVQVLLGDIRLSHVDRWIVAVAGGLAAASTGPSAGSRDALTGLASRDALLARAGSDSRRGPNGRRALFFIDLDGFKRVNDTWGHVAGDHVLRMIAQRLTEVVRPHDLVVRYGGDEFLVLIDEVSRRRDIRALARRIARAVERPILVEGHEVMLSASIGIAQRESFAGSIDMLIVEADRAMYRAKSRRQTPTPALGGAKPCMARKSLIVSESFCR